MDLRICIELVAGNGRIPVIIPGVNDVIPVLYALSLRVLQPAGA